MMSGLDSQLLKKIVDTIIGYKAVDKIVLFGSRAGQKFKPSSDIDLAIFSDFWTSTDINIVKNELEEEIPTVLKFDLLLYNNLTKEMLKSEIKKGVTIYDIRTH